MRRETPASTGSGRVQHSIAKYPASSGGGRVQNFSPLLLTVAALLHIMMPKTDIPIIADATAYTNDNGDYCPNSKKYSQTVI